MAKRDSVCLQHILDSAREAVSFSDGMTIAELETDRMRTLALTRCVEIIGEAATAISPEFKDKHATIPWRAVIAMRNRLIHAYFDVNLEILLDTVQNDLPPLISKLEEIVNTEQIISSQSEM